MCFSCLFLFAAIRAGRSIQLRGICDGGKPAPSYITSHVGEQAANQIYNNMMDLSLY